MRQQQASRRASERGFVSLFTVIFFMLLITIITIGFLRIMTAEQRQALDNDLTASAQAAAQSGIEDAKRAIIKYNSLPDTDPLKAQLQTALTSSNCNALFTSAAVRTALNLNNSGSINNQPGLNEFYTCLSVNLNTPDYIAPASAGKSEFIPLSPENGDPFEQILVSWHLASAAVGTDGDGQPSNYAPGVQLPPVAGGANSWSTRGYPAYLRVELFGYPNGSFNRGGIDQLSRSVFLVPNASSNAAAVPSSTPVNMGTIDPRGADQTKINLVGVRCTGTPPNVPVGTYACSARLELPVGQPSTSNKYYLRVTPLYGGAHFRLQMFHNSSTVVNFSGVEPIIDSTGRASDVFRRIQSRVRLDNTANMPEFSAETASDICKTMQVSDGSYYQGNVCP
jgi:Tfp pilus assembly protein PilX